MAGIDTSIIARLRAPQIQQRDPLETYGKSLALQGLMGQQEMQAMQMQQAQRGIADEEAVRSAYQQSGGDSVALRALLQKGGQHKQLQALDKFELEKRGKEATIGKDTAATGKSEWEVKLGKLQHGAALLDSAKDQGSYEQAIRIGLMTGVFDQSAVEKFPQQFNPQFIAAAKNAGLTAAQKLTDERAREGQKITMRGQDIGAQTAREGHGVTMRGQNISASTAMRGQNLTDTRQREANAVSAATAGLKQRELENTISTKDSAQESAMASYDTAIATLDRMVGKGEKGKEGYVAPHPGLQPAVGAGVQKTLMPFIGPTPGTDRAGFVRQLETFKAQTFLPMVQQLKGMGALSDAEGSKLSAAVGALNEDMSEKEFKSSVAVIKKDLEAAKARASGARPKATAGKIGGVLTQNPDGSFNYGF